ncbi:MAG TPA: oxidoreductase [Anaeromyxobacteraceae bacterium]|nr:oxidoreductase [Anaeromyxobacteraceae bacterium]
MLGPSEYHAVHVADAWNETRQLRGIRLALPPELERTHQWPGQVVEVRTAAGDAFFALATAPRPDGQEELLLKRGHPVADAVITRGAPGGSLEVTTPFGKGFPIEEARGKDVLLFAAGSGIGPIRAIVQHLIERRDGFGRVTLFYGQRRGEDFAYRDEHLSWERRGVRVILCPSGEDDAWQGVRGRVQSVARALAFGGSAPEDAMAYVCGMTAMVDDVRRTLARAGLPAERVHVNF